MLKKLFLGLTLAFVPVAAYAESCSACKENCKCESRETCTCDKDKCDCAKCSEKKSKETSEKKSEKKTEKK